MTDDLTQDEINARANEKARKRKAARDKMLADKTVEKGLLIVHTGKGKGKSTAAFGLAVRALGNGMKVGVVQFVKGKWQTGERAVLERFPEQVEIRTMGEGFTWDTQDRARDIRAAQAGWAMAQEMIEACRGDQPAYDLVILDELNIVLRYDYLPLEEVVATLQDRPTDLHVVVTGRNAKPALIEAADLVTEMTQVKHPFREQGVMAQKGIVARDESRRSHVYRPTLSRKKAQAGLVGDLIQRAFSGSTSELVLRALAAKPADPEELAAIRRYLDEQETREGSA